ncbi:hypothetical protein [Castellaniella sp.]|uniref:hypothetical protein n=1 Tax=Castellaniella sp. TaxID=1955812 RepID=UPI002AFE429D|nr:hypothetical protein [Castellaniella sp.]
MPSIEYSLFRVKMVRPHQASFLHDELTPRDILLQAILEKPSSELRKGYHWHIGNIQMFDQFTGYFAAGRTTTSTIEKFDEETSNFVEEELEASPYTHCVFDAAIGFLGIAKKPNLSQTTKGIAARLEQLLSRSLVVVKNEIAVEIRPIPDPDGFLKAIETAFKVFTFSATFRGPNPFDADEHFQKPLSVYLNAAEGIKGRTTISGTDLNRRVLQEVTRSTAATGNEASARIQKSKGQKAVTVNLKGDPVKRKYDEQEHRPEIVLADLTAKYRTVRRDGLG